MRYRGKYAQQPCACGWKRNGGTCAHAPRRAGELGAMHPSLREEKWKRSGQPGQEKPADRRPEGCVREPAFPIADQESSPANWTVNGRWVGVDPVAASFYIEALPYAILIG